MLLLRRHVPVVCASHGDIVTRCAVGMVSASGWQCARVEHQGSFSNELYWDLLQSAITGQEFNAELLGVSHTHKRRRGVYPMVLLLLRKCAL